ncbi:CGNR zinc finger domain-containing protein [Arcticibacter sp.]|uniref:CGNR zinc finger domain-containing protein n=1 Tax=Arcticibacter sp. TaxID=1872630 RepID=UPI00388D0CA1
MTLDVGNPSIDLVNSGYGAVPGEPVERLHSYLDLVTLAGRHGIVAQETWTTLTEKARKNPTAAENALGEVKAARAALYIIFSTLAKGEAGSMNQDALDTFNNFLSDALSYRKLSVKEHIPVRDWKNQEGDLRQILRFYILSAYEVITASKHMFIKQCNGCAWLFLDETKNHRRKWCNMQICGSSEKAKRYYRKRKQIV